MDRFRQTTDLAALHSCEEMDDLPSQFVTTNRVVFMPPGILPLPALADVIRDLDFGDSEVVLVVDDETAIVCAFAGAPSSLDISVLRECVSAHRFLTEENARDIFENRYAERVGRHELRIRIHRLPTSEVDGELRSTVESIFRQNDGWYRESGRMSKTLCLTYEPHQPSDSSIRLPLAHHLKAPSILGSYARLMATTTEPAVKRSASSMRDWTLADVDIIAVTTDRWRSVRHLLKSIRENLGHEPAVTVVAQTRPTARWRYLARRYRARLIHVENDLGLSASRNTAVRATSRPLVWLMDDDFQIDARCRFKDALSILSNQEDLDVLGGNLLDVPAWSTPREKEQSQGFAMKRVQAGPNLLWVRLEDIPRDRRFVDPWTYLEYCDIVDNFAMFRRETTFGRGLQWNPELKINGEHQDLYLTFLAFGGITVARTNALKVRNVRVQSRRYRRLRSREDEFFSRFLRAQSLTSFKILGDWERILSEDGRVSARFLDTAWSHQPEYRISRDYT